MRRLRTVIHSNFFPVEALYFYSKIIMLDNRRAADIYNRQKAFDTRPIDMLYTVEQFMEANQGSTAGFHE